MAKQQRAKGHVVASQRNRFNDRIVFAGPDTVGFNVPVQLSEHSMAIVNEAAQDLGISAQAFLTEALYAGIDELVEGKPVANDYANRERPSSDTSSVSPSGQRVSSSLATDQNPQNPGPEGEGSELTDGTVAAAPKAGAKRVKRGTATKTQ